jgi:hypothetical protein
MWYCKANQRQRGNTADFIARAVEIHGDQYDYSLSEYGKTAHDKVVILCRRHEPPLRFEQSPNTHLSGQGCPWRHSNAALWRGRYQKYDLRCRLKLLKEKRSDRAPRNSQAR